MGRLVPSPRWIFTDWGMSARCMGEEAENRVQWRIQMGEEGAYAPPPERALR